jgi:hypothetical protein
MDTVQIQPTANVAIPFSVNEDKNVSIATTAEDHIRIAANTAAMLAELGMPINISEEDSAVAHNLISGTGATEDFAKLNNTGVAAKLSALLTEYDKDIVRDSLQLRHYVTHRLIEVSKCGDTKLELKALELLGKSSDVGLFTERSEITITHKTSDDLAVAIKDRIKRLLNPNIIDVPSMPEDLDEALGTQDIEFQDMEGKPNEQHP